MTKSQNNNAHPEDYCHRCNGPNISWYAPSLLWNQYVRDKGEPGIVCPICFAELAKEANVTWSIVPDRVTSDYDERLAVRAARRIAESTIQTPEEFAIIIRDALVQSAAALAQLDVGEPERLAELQRELAFYFGAYHGGTDHRRDAASCDENECVRVRSLLAAPLQDKQLFPIDVDGIALELCGECLNRAVGLKYRPATTVSAIEVDAAVVASGGEKLDVHEIMQRFRSDGSCEHIIIDALKQYAARQRPTVPPTLETIAAQAEALEQRLAKLAGKVPNDQTKAE